MSGDRPVSSRSVTVAIVAHARPVLGYHMLTTALMMAARQTREPDEIVVVADEETCADAIPPACADGFGPIKLVVSPNPAVDFKRNLALRFATGDMVVWMDDDDLYGPEYIANTLTFMERYDLPAVLLARHPLIYDVVTSRTTRGGYVVGPAMAFWREFIDRAGVWFPAGSPGSVTAGVVPMNECAQMYRALLSLGLGYRYEAPFCRRRDFVFMRWPSSASHVGTEWGTDPSRRTTDAGCVNPDSGLQSADCGLGTTDSGLQPTAYSLQPKGGSWRIDTDMQLIRSIVGESICQRIAEAQQPADSATGT